MTGKTLIIKNIYYCLLIFQNNFGPETEKNSTLNIIFSFIHNFYIISDLRKENFFALHKEYCERFWIYLETAFLDNRIL